MIAFHLLVDWVLGALPPDEAGRVDEHVLACGDCAAVATRLLEMGEAVGVFTRTGLVSHVATGSLLARLSKEGVDLERYDVAPGETVSCRATATQRYAITKLEADLRGVASLEVATFLADGRRLETLSDVPFDLDAGGVFIATAGELVRALPSSPLRLTLTATDSDGRRRELGEYLLDHEAL